MKFFLIGIDDNQEQSFSPEINEIIKNHSVFSGGKRHHEITKAYLPADSTWIDITVPLENVFTEYLNHAEIVIFTSGDPLFYGFASTIQKRLPNAELIVFPSFNSLQLLAHKALLSYPNMHIVSLTGRPWHQLDKALIQGHEMIGVLTDSKEHTPSAIASRLLKYGYDNYNVIVGELLGNKENERVSMYNLQEVIGKSFAFPNNLILQKTHNRLRPFGIPEQDFHLLDGRNKMITKMPIRLLSLAALDLHDKTVLWDIGFCTGSVSIESKLQFPHLQIIAFEKRKEGKDLIEKNAIRFGTPGIQSIIGDFTKIDLNNTPSPDAVFIGGHGGKLEEIIQITRAYLKENGVIVFNSVSPESRLSFLNAIEKNKLSFVSSTQITIDNFNSIEVIKAKG